MTTLRKAAMMSLEALEEYQSNGAPFLACDGAVAALRAALAQQDEPQTLNEAMSLPRAMAQAYENGYKAGAAAEREECARACEHQPHWVSCVAAIRARGTT